MRYEYNGAWYTPKELSELSGIAAHTIRDRLRRGFTVDEAVKISPVQTSVREFCDASYYRDWIGLSITDLYEIFWRWCISQGYTPLQKQGFARQIFSIYPNLKSVPTKQGEGYNRIIRERKSTHDE